jgi:hypothetical protein
MPYTAIAIARRPPAAASSCRISLCRVRNYFERKWNARKTAATKTSGESPLAGAGAVDAAIIAFRCATSAA